MSSTSVDSWYDHITYEAETWAYTYKNDDYKEGNGRRTVYLTAQDCAEIAEIMGHPDVASAIMKRFRLRQLNLPGNVGFKIGDKVMETTDKRAYDTIIKNGKIHKDEVGEVFAIKGKTIYVCYPDTGCFKVGETNLVLLGAITITSSDQFRTC